jgi:hypothetical protein
MPFNDPDSTSSIMGASAVVKILGLGVIGFGFLLAVLAYRLLRDLQRQPDPRASVVRSIYFFMGFSIVLCTIGLAAQLADQRRSRELAESRQELARTRKEVTDLQEKVAALLQSQERLFRVGGTIEKPSPGATVPRTFPSSGTITGFEGVQGVHFWLAVEVDGLFWPKERALNVGKDGRWSMNVSEDGSAPQFSLRLIAADEAAHNKFVVWLNSGDGKGMKRIEGMVNLDRIDDLQLKTKQ